MDCEKLSQDAQEIFEKIKAYYPPDPWGKPQWKEEGLVYDNGWHDLRKNEDREKLIVYYAHLIGSTIVMFANQAHNKKEKITRSIFSWKMSKKWVQLSVMLHELDFQIETLDLVQLPPELDK